NPSTATHTQPHCPCTFLLLQSVKKPKKLHPTTIPNTQQPRNNPPPHPCVLFSPSPAREETRKSRSHCKSQQTPDPSRPYAISPPSREGKFVKRSSNRICQTYLLQPPNFNLLIRISWDSEENFAKNGQLLSPWKILNLGIDFSNSYSTLFPYNLNPHNFPIYTQLLFIGKGRDC
ncbi:hypothetical protein AABB24_028381, partial [Solanum stoloniferum]